MGYYNYFAKQNITYSGNKLAKLAALKKYEFIVKHMKSNYKTVDILEIGPGRGALAKVFINNGYINYDVVEPNDFMRGKLVTSGVRGTKQYMIPKLDEKDASYDLIILSHVFEHLDGIIEAKLFISEANRVLKKGGFIFIACPDLIDWGLNFWNGDYTHSNPTTVRRTVQLFFDADITTVEFKYYYSGFEGVVGYILSRVIKILTFSVKGENLNSKIYKLKTTFLRSFMIIGQVNGISNNLKDDVG